MDIDAITFSPAQAERLTGVSQASQRDWRRRGILPTNGGTSAAYTLEDLCGLLLLRFLPPRHLQLTDLKRAISAVVPAFADGVRRWLAHLPLVEDEQVIAVWPTGEVVLYPTIQVAVDDAWGERQDGPMTLVMTKLLLVPFADRIREELKLPPRRRGDTT